ncbi:MAG: TIGR04282 family arsenosugar biosynthesis glycosyltransferase [Pyrinomonadaceae bacterium]
MNNIAPQVCPAIIVMAKVPQAGEVKTRLRPFLSGEQAAMLAVCFLQDTIFNVKNLAENVIVAFTPPDGIEILKDILPTDLILIEQDGSDLSERLEAVIEYAASRKFSPIIIIGADSPTLPFEFIQKAIDVFKNKTDAALGATRDGGFYLIGLRGKHPGLFENVAWSSSLVFGQTRANVERLELSLFRLPDWYDIDTADDLIFLRGKMLDDKELQVRAPRTFQWLLSNSELFDSI